MFYILGMDNKKRIVKTWTQAFVLDCKGKEFFAYCYKCKELRHNNLIYTWDNKGAKCKIC
jgi:hypothetical protein